MTAIVPTTERPDYGVDAPGVVRNMFLVGAVGLLTFASAALGLWSGEVVGIPVAGIGLGFAITFTTTALIMLWYSKVGKFRNRERLLNLLPWQGGEAVLDVGCGRGLMLIAAAKRLTGGKATGVDIWQTEDLSGNRPEATRENARREGVAERVEVQTADMRHLPFADGTFDVVLSCAAIHNLYQRQDREQAIAEIARVLKPGGHALIADVRHLREYADTFQKHWCKEGRRVTPFWKTALVALFTWGAVRPGTVLVQKSPPAAPTEPGAAQGV
jgi:SAM-dependent methyltransferase